MVTGDIRCGYVESLDRNEKSWVRSSDWTPELEALGRGFGRKLHTEATLLGELIGPRGCGGALDVGVSPGVCSLGV